MTGADPSFMLRAIELASQGMLAGAGGPFGAVVVRNGEIIGEGWNQVLSTFDPTAHGEISAIRDACKNLSSWSLEGCEIYTTGEPCPMCLGAIHWARIVKIYYGFDIEQAARIGFDDRHFYAEFALQPDQRKIPATQLRTQEVNHLLNEYIKLPKKQLY